MTKPNFKDVDGNEYFITETRLRENKLEGGWMHCDKHGKRLVDDQGRPLIPIPKRKKGEDIKAPALNSDAVTQYGKLNKQNADRAAVKDKDVMTDSHKRKVFRREALTKD